MSSPEGCAEGDQILTRVRATPLNPHATLLQEAFPDWLHVLVPAGQGQGAGESGMQWQGVLHNIKAELEAEVGAVRAEVGAVRAEVGAVRAEVRAEMGAHLQHLAAIHAKLDKILLAERSENSTDSASSPV